MAKKKTAKKKKRAPAKKRSPKKRSPKKRSPKKRSPITLSKGAPPPDWQNVDRLQLAKLIGVHPDTVSDYTRAGMPVVTRGGAGRRSVYDSVECLKWWREQSGKDAKEIAQTRAYNAQAELNELKIAVQNGELLPRDEVVLAGQNYTKAWTAKIRALPRQMVQSGLIPREREQGVTQMLLALLSEISQWKTLGEGEPTQ